MTSNLPHFDRLIRLGSLVAAVGIGGGALVEQRLETRRQHREIQDMDRERQKVERHTLDLLAREAVLLNDPLVREALQVDSPAFPVVEDLPQTRPNQPELRR